MNAAQTKHRSDRHDLKEIAIELYKHAERCRTARLVFRPAHPHPFRAALTAGAFRFQQSNSQKELPP